MFKKTLSAALLTIGLCGHAQAVTLECKLPQTAAGNGYITELYYLDYDESTGQAVVADGLIYYFNKDKPIAAKVSEDTAKKLVLTWNVIISNSSGQTTKMQFRAAYFKADKSVIVRATPGGGYGGEFEGRGKCKPV